MLSPGAIGLDIQPKSDRVPCISPQWLMAFVACRRSGAESLALMEDISLSRVFSTKKVLLTLYLSQIFLYLVRFLEESL